MAKRSMFVGMDVHKESIDISVAEDGRQGEVRHYGVIPGDLEAVAKVLRALRAPDRVLHFVYEAGPCGFGIHRYFTAQGEDCVVVNPSSMPKRSGDRIKTDRRDGDALAGMDVHQESIDISLADEGRDGEVRHYGVIPGDLEALAKVVRAVRAPARRLRFVYEAGPCGFGIHRYLTTQGEDCVVVNPSSVYVDPGADAYDAQDRTRLVRRFRHRAEHLGFALVSLSTGEVLEGSVS